MTDHERPTVCPTCHDTTVCGDDWHGQNAKIAELAAHVAALTAEKDQRTTQRVELGLRLGAILGPDYDGASLEEIARTLAAQSLRLQQLEKKNAELNQRITSVNDALDDLQNDNRVRTDREEL